MSKHRYTWAEMNQHYAPTPRRPRMRNPFPERCRRPLLFLGIPALMLACIIGTALVSRDNTVAQPIPEPVCNMDVTVIGYGSFARTAWPRARARPPTFASPSPKR